jgi:hypothetical protein
LTTNGVSNSSVVDPAFIVLARSWMQSPSQRLLGFIWLAYEQMRHSRPRVDTRDLERSITQLLEPRIRDAMTGDEPFYIQHGAFERETMKKPPAQPPQYDLAFVLRADERIMWPLEAKVLVTPTNVSAYVSDIQNEFLSCRYAPFSGSGAMVGYLLSGTPNDAFATIANKLTCELGAVPDFPSRPNRISRHQRSVPSGKPYPLHFDCYHIILEYPELARAAP